MDHRKHTVTLLRHLDVEYSFAQTFGLALALFPSMTKQTFLEFNPATILFI
jgi:hypothetical protein